MFDRELQRLDWRPPRVSQAEEENVRRKLREHRDRCGTIRDFADDDESWFCFEEATQPVAKDGVLTGNDQPDEFGGNRHASQWRRESAHAHWSAGGPEAG